MKHIRTDSIAVRQQKRALGMTLHPELEITPGKHGSGRSWGIPFWHEKEISKGRKLHNE
jgi:hypothetical protein